MKKIKQFCSLLPLLTLLNLSLFAQQRTEVSGQVFDSEKRIPLPQATITVSRLHDTLHLSGASANAAGAFLLKKVPQNDSLLVEVRYTGYESFFGVLYIGSANFHMQPVYLHTVPKALQEVRIAARRPLVVIRGDTTVFNARSVKTAPNAMAEDLVKRIPGLTLDADGKLSYNGRPVSKILVDGKPFFGTDGVMALKNIPAALIDQVQLHDMLTAGEKELNEGESPNREKTLNLKLRPGAKFWASANAAGGTDKRYDAGASGTYSRGTQRISLTGGINNINKLNAGGQPDILALSSGGGITRAAGAAADMQLNNKDNINYQFQAPHTDQESATKRQQTVLGSGALVSGTNGNNRNNSAEHHLFLQRRNADSALVRRIEFVAGVRRLDNTSRSESNTQQDSRQVNTGSSAYLSKGHQHDLSALIDLGRRHKGSSWNFQLNVRNSHSEQQDRNTARNTFYRPASQDSTGILRQAISSLTGNWSIRPVIHYGARLSRHLRAGVSAGLSWEEQRTKRTTYKLDDAGQQAGQDTLYSNDLHTLQRGLHSNLYLRFDTAALHTTLSAQVNNSHYRQEDRLRRVHTGQDLTTINPHLMIDWRHWYLGLASATDGPSPDQLQPLLDNTNTLVQRRGNPNLKPQTRWNSELRYEYTASQWHAQLSSNFSAVRRKLVSDLQFDTLGRQLLSYRNANGAWQAGLDAGIGTNFRKGSSTWAIDVRFSSSYNHDLAFVNQAALATDNRSFSPLLSTGYTRGSNVDLHLDYQPSWNSLRYDGNSGADQAFVQHRLSGIANLFLLDKIKIRQSLAYNYNGGLPAGLDRSSMLWNASISLLLAGNRAEVRVSGFDLLKQNRNIMRTVGANFIEDSRSNNLQRFFLLGLSYHIMTLKGEKGS